jgi:hypothetical protein
MNAGRQVMSVRSVIKRFHRSQPYRGALIHRESRGFEHLARLFLWTGVLLCGYLACQQTYHFYEENAQLSQSTPQQKSQQKLITSIAAMPPDDVLPIVPDRLTDLVQSLFHFKQAETKPPPSVNRQPEVTYAPNEVTERTSSRVWQLEVKRLYEKNMAQQLANAKYQLQSGDVDLARQSFEQILQHDPHHVVALAGMLVVSQRDDHSQREEYLRRLRQEIPDYEPDNDLFLLQVAD